VQESRQPSLGVRERLKDADDEPELGILKDMMLAGYDSPAAAYLYLDPPLKGRYGFRRWPA